MTVIDTKETFRNSYGCWEKEEGLEYNLNEIAWQIFLESADVEFPLNTEFLDHMVDPLDVEHGFALEHIVTEMKFAFLEAAEEIFKKEKMATRSLEEWGFWGNQR